MSLIKQFKRWLANWLLKDVEIEELKVGRLRVGEGTVTMDGSGITLPGLTADPTLAAGKVWFRSDLGLLSYSPDGTAVNRIPIGTINVDAHASRHAAGGADPIPSGGIARSQLEYPTDDVYFPYLEAISKCRWYGPGVGNQAFWHFGTVDSFTDKSLWAPLPNYFHIAMRMTDGNNTYTANLLAGATTADFILDIRSAGTVTNLATEAVDIGTNDVYQVVGSISGSTLKGYRDSTYTTTPTLRISATDTTFASGAFGYTKRRDSQGTGIHEGYALLEAPSSSLPRALAILELPVEGSGKPDDPFRPLLSRNLVEISSLSGLPDFLYQEAKKYEILKAKGFTEEEMKLVFGQVPQHQVNLDAVTWGAFEIHPDKASTVIITITGDNPYRPGAIERQKARAKRWWRPPRDYGEAVELYRQLRRDYPHWLAGKENFAYQTLGWEVLDWMQNVDFYYGELIEHRTHYDQLKRVSDEEIRRRLNELIDKLSRASGLNAEREKHIDKAREVLRRGW